MYCYRCGKENPEDAQFCNKCGLQLNTKTLNEHIDNTTHPKKMINGNRECPQCGNIIVWYQHRCKKCGKYIGESKYLTNTVIIIALIIAFLIWTTFYPDMDIWEFLFESH